MNAERLLLSNLAALGALGISPPIRVIKYKQVNRTNYGPKGKKNSRKNKGKKR